MYSTQCTQFNNNTQKTSSRPPLMIQQSNTMNATMSLYGCDVAADQCDIGDVQDVHTNVIDGQESKTECIEKRKRDCISSISSIGDISSIGSPISPKSPLIMGIDNRLSSIDSYDNDDGENMFSFLKKIATIKDDETLAKHGMFRNYLN